MPKPLKILMVEDDPADADLFQRELRRTGFVPDVQRVETEEEFLAGLRGDFDLVVVDYVLPRFSGLRALELLRASCRELPLIVVSGTIGEDKAVEAIRLGATDYLIKGRLARLGLAVERALEAARLRIERLRDAEALRESERFARAALNALTTQIAILDETGTIIAVNNAWRSFALNSNAFSDKVAEGANYLAVCDRTTGPDADTAHSVARAIRAIHAGSQERFETEYPCHSPEESRWFVTRVTPFPDSGMRRVVVAHENVTARLKQEQELRTSEERFREIAETIQEVFWITDPNKKQMLYISPGYERVWGRTCQSLYDSPRTWLEAIHSEDREAVFQAALTKQAEHGAYDMKYRILRPDGTTRWIRDRAFPVNDAAGGLKHIVGVAEDITDSRKMEERLRQSQKMEAVGTLAGGIAHDFNNMLAAIMLHLDLLKLDASVPASMQDSLGELSQAARRAAGLTRKLLLFSRQEPAIRQRVDLTAVVGGLLTMLHRMVGENYSLAQSGAHRPLWLQGDPGMLELVAMNLVVNARDAMPRGGSIKLRLDELELRDDTIQWHPAGRRGRFVRLTVTDTGCGMSAATKQRIFEPFFTTKSADKGTGLGLSTVFGIVEQHAGWIEVESTEGQGSTFTVYFPAASGTGDEHESPAPANAPTSREVHGSILVVDDNHSMRSAAASILRKQGYRVLEAGDGVEARKVLVNESVQVELLVTDELMPGGVLGHELADELQRRNERLKVILMSGRHSMEEQALLAGGISAYLMKPFTADQLTKVVREVLSNPPIHE